MKTKNKVQSNLMFFGVLNFIVYHSFVIFDSVLLTKLIYSEFQSIYIIKFLSFSILTIVVINDCQEIFRNYVIITYKIH